MIPQFDVPVSAEMLRDGGSLAMSFASRGDRYWLLFPRSISEQSGRDQGYIRPVVVNRTLGIEHDVTWELARGWLEKANGLINTECTDRWVKIMLDVAESEGKVSKDLLEKIWYKG